MQALKKWRVDLLGSHIHIHMDHKTLQNFDSNETYPSVKPTGWSICRNMNIPSHNREQNTVADALSCLPGSIDVNQYPVHITAIFTIQSNPKTVTRIKNGYREDPGV